jgi:hypothetical protein
MKYPKCFKNLSFHTNGTQPFSDEIEAILMRAYISGVIACGNFLSNDRKEAIINHIKNKKILNPNQYNQLNDIILDIKTNKLI